MEKNFKVGEPKTIKERIEWLRKNDPKFQEEEKLVKEVKEKIKPK